MVVTGTAASAATIAGPARTQDGLTPSSSQRDLPILTENLQEHLFLSQAQKTNEVLQLLPQENLPVPPQYIVKTAPTPPASPTAGRLDELLLRWGASAELCTQLALLTAEDAENYGQPVSMQCKLGMDYGQVFSPNAVLKHLTSHLVGPEGFWDPSPAGNIEEIVIEAGERLIVVGDTHGQLNDVLWIFLKYGLPSDTNRYLFDGDIADRGGHALEILLLLFAFKRDCKSSVYILRGNHEDYSMNAGGFEDELKHKFALLNYGQIWQACHLTIWPLLPVAATIASASQARRFVVVHGGLPVEIPGFDGRPVHILDDIGSLDRKRPSVVYPHRQEDDPASMLLFHLLWADPEETSGAMRGNPFNERQTMDFCQVNDVELLIRAHNPPSNWRGAEWHHQNRCITIFSASNYCGRMSNRGGVLICMGDSFPILKEHTAPGYARLAYLLPTHLSADRAKRQEVVAEWEGSVPSGPLGQPFRDLDDDTAGVQIVPVGMSEMEELPPSPSSPTRNGEPSLAQTGTPSSPRARSAPSALSPDLPSSSTSPHLLSPQTSAPALFAPPPRSATGAVAEAAAAASASSRVLRRTCELRHPLVRFTMEFPVAKCDGCQLKWGKGSIMYGCRSCNYDLCPQCMKNGISKNLFQTGQPVQCLYKNGHWYTAVINERRHDGNYLIDWEDAGPEDRVKSAEQIRVKTIFQTCPQKHRLVGFANGNIIKFRCDNCGRLSDTGAVIYGCRKCDYDLCKDCADQMALTLPAQGECPEGHKLKEFATPTMNWRCNVCRKQFPQGTLLRGCRECNFDLCESCRIGLKATSASPAVSEVWESLARFLEEQIVSHKKSLFEAFIARDPTLGGKVSQKDWVDVMLNILSPAVNKPGVAIVLSAERLDPMLEIWGLSEPIAYARFLHRFQIQGCFASWDMLETCSVLMKRLSETSHFELSKLLDKDGDGSFSYDEFHSFLSTFFEKVPRWQAARLYEAMVQVQGRRPSKGDHLRLDDAILCLALTSRDPPEDNEIAQEGSDRVGRAIQSSGQSYVEFFRTWDTSSSGFLSLKELQAGLQHIAQNPIDPNMLMGFKNDRLSIFNFVRAVAPREIVIKIQMSMVKDLLAGVWLQKERLQGLFGLYDSECTGKVSAEVFKDCIDAIEQFEKQEGRHAMLSAIQKAAVVEVATQGEDSIEYGPFFEELKIVDRDMTSL